MLIGLLLGLGALFALALQNLGRRLLLARGLGPLGLLVDLSSSLELGRGRLFGLFAYDYVLRLPVLGLGKLRLSSLGLGGGAFRFLFGVFRSLGLLVQSLVLSRRLLVIFFRHTLPYWNRFHYLNKQSKRAVPA